MPKEKCIKIMFFIYNVFFYISLSIWMKFILPFYFYLAKGKPLVLLLFNAGPLDITWAKLHPYVHVIMACFFPAQSAGQALYNTLTGASPDAHPAGRLSMTWPANMQQVYTLYQ